MELSSQQFEEFIQEIESNPLFKRFMYPKEATQGKEKIISYNRFPRTEIETNFYEFPEAVIKDNSRIDVDSLLEAKKEVVKIIRRLGVDKFKRYFLYNEFDSTIEELAKDCRLSKNECGEIIDFINKIFIQNKYQVSSMISARGINYNKVASIYKKDERGFIISFSNLSLARGRYKIDFQRFSQLKETETFSKQELRDINKLIRRLNLINLRKSTIFNVLQIIVKKQKAFLKSGKAKDIIPLSQKEVAKELGISASLISRAIKYKSIETPWTEEKPLKYFFPSLKAVRIQILELLLQENLPLDSDEAISQMLKRKYGIYISRRTVSKYRKELSIPSYRRADR
jgi:RNA polymerase sigma-54 factor